MSARRIAIAAVLAVVSALLFYAWRVRSTTFASDHAPVAASAPDASLPVPPVAAPAPAEREHEELEVSAPRADSPRAETQETDGELGSILLHVVDRDSRSELGDVTVAADAVFLFHVGDDTPSTDRLGATLVEHAASPVRVERRRKWAGDNILWVRAAGWSWAHVEIDFTKPEATVELVPAADLLVEVRGRLPDANRGKAHLRVRDPRLPRWTGDTGDVAGDDSRSRPGYVVFDAAATIGTTAVPGVRPGPLVVAVELGDRNSPPLVLASKEVEPSARQTTRIALELDTLPRVVRVPLSGTLVVPSTWPAGEWIHEDEENTPDDQELKILPIDLKGATEDDEQAIALSSMTPIEGTPGAYRWSARPVQPARFAFLFQAAGFARAVDVPSGGRSDLEIVLPEAATLRLRVTSAKDGAPVWPEGVSFRRDADGVRDLLWEVPLRAGATPGEFEGRVPVGPGRLSCSDGRWQFDPASAWMEIHPGPQEVAVTARRRLQISIRLACRGERVSWPMLTGMATRIEPIGSAEASDSATFGTDATTFGIPSRGRYRITIPALVGYEDVPPFEVEFADDDVERVIELKPR
jgi:hypothetical protein